MRLVLVPRGMSDMHSQATLEYMIAGVDMILCLSASGRPNRSELDKPLHPCYECGRVTSVTVAPLLSNALSAEGTLK